MCIRDRKGTEMRAARAARFFPRSTNHVTYLWRFRCRCRRRCVKTVASRNELTCPPGRPTGPSTPLSPGGPYR